MSAVPMPVEVFCSYAHEDEVWLRKLKRHLSLLQRQGLISREERIARAKALFREIFIVADEIIGCNPEIFDPAQLLAEAAVRHALG